VVNFHLLCPAVQSNSMFSPVMFASDLTVSVQKAEPTAEER